MLCFRVQINNDPPIVAGEADISVLAATLTWVSSHDDLGLRLGGLVGHGSGSGDHVDWLNRKLRIGDRVVIDVVDSDTPEPPTRRETSDRELLARERRHQYEQLKREFEPT
jgi:hypothetical protein